MMARLAVIPMRPPAIQKFNLNRIRFVGKNGEEDGSRGCIAGQFVATIRGNPAYVPLFWSDCRLSIAHAIVLPSAGHDGVGAPIVFCAARWLASTFPPPTLRALSRDRHTHGSGPISRRTTSRWSLLAAGVSDRLPTLEELVEETSL
jgi:hypothetical protein